MCVQHKSTEKCQIIAKNDKLGEKWQKGQFKNKMKKWEKKGKNYTLDSQSKGSYTKLENIFSH